MNKFSSVNVIFISKGPPSWHLGGSSVFCDAILSIVNQAGQTLYATGDNSNQDLTRYCGVNRLRLIPIHTAEIRPNIVIGIPSLDYIRTLLGLLARGGCNIYMFEINSPASFLHLLLRSLSRLFGYNLRIILFPMGMVLSRDDNEKKIRILLNRIKIFVQSISINSADIVHCQSVDEVNNVTRLVCGAKSKTIMMPLISRASIDFLKRNPSPKTYLNMGAKLQEDRWLSLCRVTPEKGLDKSIMLLSMLRLKDPTFIAYGRIIDKGYERYLRTLAEEMGVRLIRRTEFSSDARFKIYSSFHVLALLPTVHEDSSLATIEMILAGRKTLINSNCLPPQYSSYSTQCFVYEPEYSSIEAVRAWLEKPVQEACYQAAIETFTPSLEKLLF